MNTNVNKSTTSARTDRHYRRRSGKIATMTVGLLVLAGCGGFRQTFGLDHAPPDEFSVVSQAPLSLPPEYNLRPPRPGAPRPQDMAANQAAAAAIFGSKEAAGAQNNKSGPGESKLLNQAGYVNAQSNIRATLDSETRDLVVGDKRWVDYLLFWQKQSPPYTVVDATKESQRLRENAALGKSPTTGETPTIERKRKAPLEGIF
ncbi:MAG: DUF3035 domain-containing protein [Rhodospirillaceae bacterium]